MAVLSPTGKLDLFSIFAKIVVALTLFGFDHMFVILHLFCVAPRFESFSPSIRLGGRFHSLQGCQTCPSLHVTNVTERIAAVGNPKRHQKMGLATVVRTANLGIDTIDKGVEAQADQKQHSGEYGGRQRTVMISAEEGFQRGAQ
jgi:hypothetical protein